MNIMLVSVMERTREIGVRKAIGARRADILTQVIVESMTLSGLGAVVGVGVGVALTLLVGAVSPLPAAVAPRWGCPGHGARARRGSRVRRLSCVPSRSARPGGRAEVRMSADPAHEPTAAPVVGEVPTGRVLREGPQGRRVGSARQLDALRARRARGRHWGRRCSDRRRRDHRDQERGDECGRVAGPDNFALMPFDFSDARASFVGGKPPWWGPPGDHGRRGQEGALAASGGRGGLRVRVLGVCALPVGLGVRSISRLLQRMGVVHGGRLCGRKGLHLGGCAACAQRHGRLVRAGREACLGS